MLVSSQLDNLFKSNSCFNFVGKIYIVIVQGPYVQAQAMVELVKMLGWTYVSTVAAEVPPPHLACSPVCLAFVVLCFLLILRIEIETFFDP